MNRKIGMAGSLVNAVTVALFAFFMLIRFSFGSYCVCIFLSISYMCMTAAFDSECTEEKKTAGRLAMILSAVYATLIMIVYYTQCTVVHNEELGEEAARILDYSYMGLMFDLDLLGYAVMALSGFFAGLALNVRNKKDKALKILLLVHGLFFFSCFFMPMTGMFAGGDGSTSYGGIIALEIWCLYFLPIGILSFMHFREGDTKYRDEMITGRDISSRMTSRKI